VGQEVLVELVDARHVLNEELYVKDLRYTDVSSFGRTMVGLDEFVKYNFAFFDAIPDWRYDPLPGEIYVDLLPDGKVRIVVRYLGSGHWSGPLRLYPTTRRPPPSMGPASSSSATASTVTTSTRKV